MSVQKRVIKILRDICVEHPDYDKIPDICARMIRRINDEAGIKVMYGHFSLFYGANCFHVLEYTCLFGIYCCIFSSDVVVWLVLFLQFELIDCCSLIFSPGDVCVAFILPLLTMVPVLGLIVEVLLEREVLLAADAGLWMVASCLCCSCGGISSACGDIDCIGCGDFGGSRFTLKTTAATIVTMTTESSWYRWQK